MTGVARLVRLVLGISVAGTGAGCLWMSFMNWTDESMHRVLADIIATAKPPAVKASVPKSSKATDCQRCIIIQRMYN